MREKQMYGDRKHKIDKNRRAKLGGISNSETVIQCVTTETT